MTIHDYATSIESQRPNSRKGFNSIFIKDGLEQIHHRFPTLENPFSPQSFLMGENLGLTVQDVLASKLCHEQSIFGVLLGLKTMDVY